jgi:hypothetical protein
MSVMVINEDHYVNKVFHGAGIYEMTMEEFDTPYVVLAARTLVNASDPADIKRANALQDQLKIEAASATSLIPTRNTMRTASLRKTNTTTPIIKEKKAQESLHWP